MNYINIINDLNEELYEKFGDEIERDFNYSSNGCVDIISFGEIMLWNSEMEDRDWDEDNDDYEPLEPFIKKTFNELVGELQRYKF